MVENVPIKAPTRNLLFLNSMPYEMIASQGRMWEIENRDLNGYCKVAHSIFWRSKENRTVEIEAGKNIVHLSNRSFRTAPLKDINYKRFGIKEIQFYKNSILWDKRSLYIIYLYNLLGLSTVFLPNMLLKNSGSIFGSEFEKKFPSTGLLAIYYALEIIKPKNLYIVGLDFYQSDYLIRREWNTPIEIMQKKMSKADCSGVVNNWIKNYQKVNFIFGTYFDGFKPQKNLKIF